MADTKKYLDYAGLVELLKKLKAEFVAKEAGKGLSTNDFTNELKSKLEGIADGAQVNVIEGVKVNGTAAEIKEKIVEITLGALAAKDLVAEGDLADELKAKVNAAAEGNHSHANKELLDTYTQTEADLADAVAKKHAHTNEAELNLIKTGDVEKWNGAQAAAEATAAGALSAAKTELEGKITAEENRAKGEEAKNAQAAADALAEAQAKVASVAAGDNSVTVGGTDTAPTVAVKLDPAADNAIKLGEAGLKVEIGAAPEYSIVKAADSGEYAAVYNLTKDGTVVGTSINIPKDMVVQSGEVVTNPEGQAAGTYIKLVLQNVAEPLFINVGDLIEYVTSGSATGDMVVVTVSDDHKVTATITDGTITAAKLTTEVQTAIGKAHTHENADVLNGITAQDVANWNTVLDFAAITEADIESAWTAAV